MAEERPDILVERNVEGVSTILLNAPARRNAFGPGMMGRLADAVEAEGAGDCRLILLRGAGGSFCAGRALSVGDNEAPDDPERRLADAVRLAQVMLRCPKPIVAIVEGYAIGVGMSLALWCDFAIAESRAKFAAPEVRLGFPPTLTAVTLTRRIARPHAMDLLLSGRRIGAQEALAMGLVRSVVDAEALDGAIAGIVVDFEKTDPAAAAACKALLSKAETLSFEDALAEAGRASLAAEGTETRN
jgi:methylglutaconyl-CoA hydratase